MAGRRLTVVRFEEVKRLLAVGRSVRGTSSFRPALSFEPLLP